MKMEMSGGYGGDVSVEVRELCHDESVTVVCEYGSVCVERVDDGSIEVRVIPNGKHRSSVEPVHVFSEES